jgi:hypothetical protein
MISRQGWLSRGHAWSLLLGVLIMSLGGLQATAAELEADAWPEIDIWIKLDEIKQDRLYILLSFTEEPTYQYEETAIGLSWDRRFSPNWSWRVGARYIDKQVNPPDQGETRVVLDLKWFYPLGKDWLLTDRNRLDLRHFDGDTVASFRYRNRLMLEKPFELLSQHLTGFGSYELYYDSRWNSWGQRQRLIAGVSIPVTVYASIDIFGAYHVEKKPKFEDGEAMGVAFGLFFLGWGWGGLLPSSHSVCVAPCSRICLICW